MAAATGSDEGIEWGRWEPAPSMSHYDNRCQVCDTDKALTIRFGKTDVAGRMVCTHVAFRCPGCGERRVYPLQAGTVLGDEIPEWYVPPDHDRQPTLWSSE